MVIFRPEPPLILMHSVEFDPEFFKNYPEFEKNYPQFYKNGPKFVRWEIKIAKTPSFFKFDPEFLQKKNADFFENPEFFIFVQKKACYFENLKSVQAPVPKNSV